MLGRQFSAQALEQGKSLVFDEGRLQVAETEAEVLRSTATTKGDRSRKSSFTSLVNKVVDKTSKAIHKINPGKQITPVSTPSFKTPAVFNTYMLTNKLRDAFQAWDEAMKLKIGAMLADIAAELRVPSSAETTSLSSAPREHTAVNNWEMEQQMRRKVVDLWIREAQENGAGEVADVYTQKIKEVMAEDERQTKNFFREISTARETVAGRSLGNANETSLEESVSLPKEEENQDQFNAPIQQLEEQLFEGGVQLPVEKPSHSPVETHTVDSIEHPVLETIEEATDGEPYLALEQCL
jgi:hypothetical protein